MSEPEAAERLWIEVVTLFPELFDAPLHASVIGRAVERGIIRFDVHDLREQGLGRHRSVDDYPYGGGAGMVIRPEPLYTAIEPLREAGAQVILMDPAGERLTDALARELAVLPHLALVCGRYEGVDERARRMVDREVSIGDYVLTGGELPALVLIDALARLVPGVIEAESHEDDSLPPACSSIRNTRAPSHSAAWRCRRCCSPAITARSIAGAAARRCGARWSGVPTCWPTPRSATPTGASSTSCAGTATARRPVRLRRLRPRCYTPRRRDRCGCEPHVRIGQGAGTLTPSVSRS